MPFIYIHFPPFIVICSLNSLLIRNIQKFILQRAVSLRLFINTMLAQNAIQQIPFFRLLLPPPPPGLFFFFLFPFLYISNYKTRSFYFSLRRNVQSQPSVDDSVGGTPPSPSARRRCQPWHHEKDFAFLKVLLPLRSGGEPTPPTPAFTRHPRASSAKKNQTSMPRHIWCGGPNPDFFTAATGPEQERS